jgi:hypothetical protein
MERYYRLLEEKRKNSEEIKREKKELNRRFLGLHKNTILLFDWAMVLIILFNLGAVFMTSMLAVKKNPGIELKEANSVQAAMNNYELHPGGNKIMSALLKQCFLWAIIIFGYIYTRNNLISEDGLAVLMFIIILYLVFTGVDFTNDLGYYVGKMLYVNLSNPN